MYHVGFRHEETGRMHTHPFHIDMGNSIWAHQIAELAHKRLIPGNLYPNEFNIVRGIKFLPEEKDTASKRNGKYVIC